MQLNVYEILDLVRLSDKKNEKITVLRKHDCWALRTVLFGAFSDSVQFYRSDAPNGYVPDFASPVQMGFSNLTKELPKMYLFSKTGNLRDKKKDDLLLQLLESLEAKESQVVINMMSKNLRINGLTRELVQEAFPKLLS